MIKNERGFTLIEMMIVLLVISVLLIISIPNVANHNSTINTKGCDAFVKMVEAQVQAYELDEGSLPNSISQLQSKGYLTDEQDSCPNGDKLTIDANGNVNVVKGG